MIAGGLRGRVIAVCVSICLFLLPVEMVGYVRYVGWCSLLVVPAWIILADQKSKLVLWCAIIVLGGLSVIQGRKWLWNGAMRVDNMYRVITLKQNGATMVLGVTERSYLGNAVLLARGIHASSSQPVVCNEDDPNWVSLCGGGQSVRVRSALPIAPSGASWCRDRQDVLGQCAFMAFTLGWTYPRVVFSVVRNRFFKG